MAYIRELSNGKYQVCWRENLRDDYGAPILGRFTQRTETVGDSKQAERRKVAIEIEIEDGGSPAGSKATAQQPLAFYARAYFDALTISDQTVTGYRDIYRVHIQPVFGNRPVSSILPSDVDSWVSSLLTEDRSEKTVKQALGVLRRILRKAVLDKAIVANPTAEVRISTSSKRRKAPFKHNPLTAGQIASIADYIASEQNNPVFALAVTFAGFTGLRAAEVQGLQIGDLTLSEHAGTAGSVKVDRTKTRRRSSQWILDTPKSEKSIRTVPIDGWLADDLRAYLHTQHLRSDDREAPLFPGRLNRHRASELGRKFGDPVDMLDWDSPIVCAFVYETNFQPALEALEISSARWHDLRHSFAVMSLSSGEHYMQVSKWLGHATFTLTLDTYGDYINEAEGGKVAPLARPTALPRKSTVVPIRQVN